MDEHKSIRHDDQSASRLPPKRRYDRFDFRVATNRRRNRLHFERSAGCQDVYGHKVLSVYARVSPLGWLVFVELPAEEAYASLYDSIKRSGAIIFTGLMLAFLSVQVFSLK